MGCLGPSLHNNGLVVLKARNASTTHVDIDRRGVTVPSEPYSQSFGGDQVGTERVEVDGEDRDTPNGQQATRVLPTALRDASLRALLPA